MINNEEKKYLDELSSYFKKERERAAIKAAVASKITDTDFGKLSIPKNGMSGFAKGGIAFLITVIIGTVLYFGVIDEPWQIKESGQESSTVVNKDQSVNNEEMSGSPAAVKGEPADQEKNKDNGAQEKGEQSSEDEIGDMAMNTEQPDKSQVVESTDTSTKIEDSKGERHTGRLTLPENVELTALESQLKDMLRQMDFKIASSESSRDYLKMETNEYTGVNKSGETVDYKIELLVDRNISDQLKVSLVYYQSDKDIASDNKVRTIEEIFYNRMAGEIKSMFSKQ